MITVIYYPEHCRLTMEGHSGADEKGKDLICAAATHNLYMFASAVEMLCKQKFAKKPDIQIEEGKADVSCRTKEGYKNICTFGLATVVAGFALLASKYPENIKFIEKN